MWTRTRLNRFVKKCRKVFRTNLAKMIDFYLKGKYNNTTFQKALFYKIEKSFYLSFTYI